MARHPYPAALAELIGRTRASILELLAEPTGTARVARLAGISAPTASAHLHTLLATGLVTRAAWGAKSGTAAQAWARHSWRAASSRDRGQSARGSGRFGALNGRIGRSALPISADPAGHHLGAAGGENCTSHGVVRPRDTHITRR
jgi:hypothetical protein